MAKFVALFWGRFLFYTFCIDYSRILLSHHLKLGQQRQWQCYLVLIYFLLQNIQLLG